MSEAPQEQKKPRRIVSLRLKLLIGFTLLFSVVFAVAYYWFYHFATDNALGQIAEDLQTTLEAAAANVDGDALQALYAELSTDERCAVPADPEGVAGFYPDDVRYWDHVNWLTTVHNIEPRAWLYTYVRGERPNEMIFIGSNGATLDPPVGATFCYRLIADNAVPPYKGLEQTTLDLEGYTDEFGYWVSGYTPITNSSGEVVGGLGVDFFAEYVEGVKRAILNSMLVAFAVTYTTLFILVYVVSGVLTQPIGVLTRVAERIGEGDYEQDLSGLSGGRFPDEIALLAGVFDIMIDKVSTRERNLRKQVEELQIVVDQSKRDRQVSEIVESDFFQDLQRKAHEMRRRSRGEQADSEEGEEE